MSLVVVGMGRFGLVEAVVRADRGHFVCGVDVDKRKIERLRRGVVPFEEPGLAVELGRQLRGLRLCFSSDLASAVEWAATGGGDLVVEICVGTPTVAGKQDLSQVEDVVRELAKVLPEEGVVVIRSTVLPGTTYEMRQLWKGVSGKEVCMGFMPEFMREGSAVNDVACPMAMVIGADDDHTAEVLKRTFAPGWDPADVALMDTVTAELSKYASNVMLATTISLMGELARLATELGADIDQVRDVLLEQRRFGNVPIPGVGWGGSCLPKDSEALLGLAERSSNDLPVLRSAIESNDISLEWIWNALVDPFWPSPEGKKVLVVGLSFKPGTDDVRESRSLRLIKWLLRAGVEVVAYDSLPGACQEVLQYFEEEEGGLEVIEDLTSPLVNQMDGFVFMHNDRRHWETVWLTGIFRKPRKRLGVIVDPWRLGGGSHLPVTGGWLYRRLG